jgi:GNAT superfamily N-acetyltransferase
MPDEPLRILEDSAAADIAFLENQINEHNADVTGHRDGRMLTILLRDDRGAIRAGVSGHTWGGCAEVKLLWVREAERRSGIGSRLLAAAEREARERGCRQIVLSTHSFQAPLFYKKHGYTVSGEFPGYPIGGSQIFLRKALG